MCRKFILVFFSVAMLAVSSFGQTSGSISGAVTDSSGSVIVGATIAVTNPQTNFTRETTSNSTGNYNFPELPPGVYNVRAQRDGFQSEVHDSVELQVQQTARIDFRLNVGAVTETVEVSGGAPLLNTENATVGTVIEQKRIEDLPLNGRNFVSLIALSPNVIVGQTAGTGQAASRGNSERGATSISIAGLRREFNYYTLDGVSNTDVSFNTYAFLPSVDSLQEFKVQTGVYSAEFGREAAQINISTKSGTNGYHGTLFEFLRNNDLDARPFGFTSKVPSSAPFKWNQYGFTLSGPVQIPKVFDGKNRLFFMSNYEGFKLRSQGQQVFSVPSAAMRTGDFSELLPKGIVIKDPTAGNVPFGGNIIPTQRLDHIALGLLEFYPTPNVPGAGLVSNYLALENNTSDKNQFTQRFDFVENAKSSWFGRYSWQEESLVAPNLPETGTVQSVHVYQSVISNTRIVSPTLVNEFRAGYLGYHTANPAILAFKRDPIKELGIPFYLDPPPIGWGIPSVSISGFSTFGDNGMTPFVADDHTFQFVDGLSWTHGTHSIKLGAEIRRDRFNMFGNQSTRGSFTVQNQATGYGFGDYMLGYTQQSGDAGAMAVTQLRATSQAYYITDNWKLRPNLTIEVGLRYEYTPPWTSKGDSMMNGITPYVGDPALILGNVPASLHPFYVRDCAAYGQTDFYPPESIVRFDSSIKKICSSSYGGTTLVHNNLTNFAPRLGIAWSPSQKWTVRLGAGIFYVQDSAGTFLDTARNVAARAFVVADTTHNLTFEHPFPASANCGVPSPPFVCVSTPLLLANDPNRRTPYLEEYELNVQRQLTNSTVLEIGYLGSQGHRLQRGILFNGAVPGPTGSIASRTDFPEFGTGQETVGWANSNYESGSVKLTRRLSKGLSALVSYTFSKSFDNASAIVPSNSNNGNKPQRGWCVSKACGEYALSDFDSRHRFVTSILYQMPFGKGKQFLTHGILSNVLGGWQLNSIVTRSSGFPVQLGDGVNQSNSNTQFDRPNAVPGASAGLANPSPDQWFNINSVILEPFGTYGNVARNTITSPGVFSWDFSTLKNFNFTEERYLQFRFECFNCANHPNFADPGSLMNMNQINSAGLAIPGTGTFGKITTTRGGIDMRQLQFSLKLIF